MECMCEKKKKPRSEEELKRLKNRLNRMTGQINGISRMLDENRYCGEILIQVAAVESALRAFGQVVFREHMETCVMEELQNGNTEIIDETIRLMEKLQ